MICYIKNFKDFRTIAKYDAVSYSLSDGEDGSITIYEKNPIELTTKYVGCWLIANEGYVESEDSQYTFSTMDDEAGGTILNILGSELNAYETQLATGGLEYKIVSKKQTGKQTLYYVSGCSPSGNNLELTLRHPIYAFERAVLYDGSKTYGELIKNILDNNYGSRCPDSEYAMTYMSVSNSDYTACSIEPDQFGYIVPSDIFEYARTDGVVIDFQNTANNTLFVNISTAAYNPGYIVFGDGHSIIQSESYDASYCAKATILSEMQSDYYIIAESDVFDARNDIKYFVQISEEISKTKETGVICLAARMYIEWPESSISGPDTYSSNRFDIWLGNSQSGTSLLSVVPSWDRSPEAGSHTTEWFEMTPINGASPIQIYCICRADGANGMDRNILFTLDMVAQSSEINIGPGTNGSEIYYRVLDYYLTINKEVVRDPPSIRPKGAWNIYQANTGESPLSVAVGAFSGNSDNHKIEFYSDKRFEYYQPMILRLRGEVIDTVITSRTISRADGRYFYKCGNLMTTLTDHVRGLEKSSKS